MNNPLISVESLTKSYGGIVAIRELTFQVAEGEALGVIGPNGAGKTTLLNLITGVDRPTGGRVLFAGRDVVAMKPHQLAEKGLTRTFQNLQVFNRLSAIENVMVAAQSDLIRSPAAVVFPTASRRRKEAEARALAEQCLSRVGLQGVADRLAGNLPYGMLKRLELARALALIPKCVLLDEPAAGCNPTEANELRDVIRSLMDSNATIVLVEHHVPMVMSLCTRIVVLDKGALLASGSPEEISEDQRVIEAYLGDGGKAS